jgi:hypothetical protein
MIRPDCVKWNQTADDFRRLVTEAPYPRTRERFLALYQIANGQSNATQWAAQIGRCDESVMGWFHSYNEQGPESLTFCRTAGTAPFFDNRNTATGRGRDHHGTDRARPAGTRFDPQEIATMAKENMGSRRVPQHTSDDVEDGLFELEKVQETAWQTQS